MNNTATYEKCLRINKWLDHVCYSLCKSPAKLILFVGKVNTTVTSSLELKQFEYSRLTLQEDNSKYNTRAILIPYYQELIIW